MKPANGGQYNWTTTSTEGKQNIDKLGDGLNESRKQKQKTQLGKIRGILKLRLVETNNDSCIENFIEDNLDRIQTNL